MSEVSKQKKTRRGRKTHIQFYGKGMACKLLICQKGKTHDGFKSGEKKGRGLDLVEKERISGELTQETKKEESRKSKQKGRDHTPQSVEVGRGGGKIAHAPSG